ncbi:DMT family transporter [Aureimonas altamirensis]|uniref:DMT family transporter n=1 Tax=Aureimonas altamirensis TaxID=370622 RepID=UPI003016CBA8
MHGDRLQGLVNGFIGVAIFSGSLPATRIAVTGFDPLFLTTARASIAGLLACALLILSRARALQKSDIASLVIVALGVVIGFPLLTALALGTVTSAHSIVFIGLLPLATSIFAVFRAGEMPKPAYWLFACLGSAFVAGFALMHGTAELSRADGYMVAAVVLCALGYAEGARLARRMGGWQVISWALVVALPPMLVATAMRWPASLAGISPAAWTSLGYVSLFSMLIGFVFWYRGLAQGGVAAVGQLQLLQPFMGLALAGLLLGEAVSPAMWLATIGVVLCVAGARRFAA